MNGGIQLLVYNFFDLSSLAAFPEYEILIPQTGPVLNIPSPH